MSNSTFCLTQWPDTVPCGSHGTCVPDFGCVCDDGWTSANDFWDTAHRQCNTPILLVVVLLVLDGCATLAMFLSNVVYWAHVHTWDSMQGRHERPATRLGRSVVQPSRLEWSVLQTHFPVVEVRLVATTRWQRTKRCVQSLFKTEFHTSRVTMSAFCMLRLALVGLRLRCVSCADNTVGTDAAITFLNATSLTVYWRSQYLFLLFHILLVEAFVLHATWMRRLLVTAACLRVSSGWVLLLGWKWREWTNSVALAYHIMTFVSFVVYFALGKENKRVLKLALTENLTHQTNERRAKCIRSMQHHSDMLLGNMTKRSVLLVPQEALSVMWPWFRTFGSVMSSWGWFWTMTSVLNVSVRNMLVEMEAQKAAQTTQQQCPARMPSRQISSVQLVRHPPYSLLQPRQTFALHSSPPPPHPRRLMPLESSVLLHTSFPPLPSSSAQFITETPGQNGGYGKCTADTPPPHSPTGGKPP